MNIAKSDPHDSDSSFCEDTTRQQVKLVPMSNVAATGVSPPSVK